MKRMGNLGQPPAWLRWTLLAVLVAAVLVLVFVWVQPGPISIDEVTYHRMTRSLVHGRGFTVWNGYTDLPSPELTSVFMRPAEGQLVAQYPYGGALLAAPFYVLFGYLGLFLVNALAFAAAVALCYRVAVQLLDDRWLAISAAGLLVGGTYFIDYGLAAWPHAVAVCAVLGAFSLAVSANRRRSDSRRSLALAATAGLIAGLGTSVRLDVLFCVPALAAPFFLSSPTRWRQLVALLAGLVPGTLLIMVTNLARWHTLSPVSYGATDLKPARFAGFLAAGVAATAGAWLVSRPRVYHWLRARWRVAVASGALALLVSLLVPPTRNSILSLARGFESIVFDMRALPLKRLGPAMHRSTGGAVIYDYGLKKALLQSCPFIALTFITLVRMAQRRTERAALAWLWVAPCIYIGFFGAYGWHGGLALNMRYLLPALPFVCILAAYGGREVVRRVGPIWLLTTAATAVAAAACYELLLPPFSALGELELFVLSLPLLWFVLLAGVCFAWLYRERTATAIVALLLTGAAIGWSAGAAGHDTWWSHRRRNLHHAIASEVASRLPDDALLFADLPDPFYGVIEDRPHVRIAIPYYDNFASARALMAQQHERGGRIFGALVPGTWQELRNRGALRDTDVEPIEQIGPYVLAEIKPR